MHRECDRHGLALVRIARTMEGDDPEKSGRKWWEYVVVACAIGVLIWLASNAERQSLPMDTTWMAILLVASFGFLLVSGYLLWKRTNSLSCVEDRRPLPGGLPAQTAINGAG